MKLQRLSFLYDRRDYVNKTHLLIDFVDKFWNQEILSLFLRLVSFATSVDIDALKQHCKRYTCVGYSYHKSNFSLNENSLKTIIQYFGFFLFVLIKSQKQKGRRLSERISLIDIEEDKEIEYFNFLKEHFDFSVIGVRKLRSPDTHVFRYRENYQISLILRLFIINTALVLPLAFTLGYLLRCNFVRILISIINQSLYAEALVKRNGAKVFISWRDYNNYSILKSIVNRAGAELFLIQRTRHWVSPIASFFDFDTYLCFGEYFGKLALDLKGHLNKIVSIGSLVSLHNDFPAKATGTKKEFDFLFIDSPFQEHLNISWDYRKRHFQTYDWLLSLKQHYPNARIAVAARRSYPIDASVLNELKKYDIEILQDVNTYDLIASTPTILTFYSTMGFEALAEGKRCIFMDPQGFCEYLPPATTFPLLRATTFKQLIEMIENHDALDQQNVIVSSIHAQRLILNELHRSLQGTT